MDRNDTILIAGGTKGIGFAAAVELVALGYRQFVLGYHLSDARALKAKGHLESTSGVKVILVKGDVADKSTIDALIQAVEDEFQGSLYAIVHTAGKYLPETMGPEVRYEQYQSMYGKAFWRLVEKGLPMMEKNSHGGRIVTLSTPGVNLLASPRPFYYLPGCAKASLEYMVRHYANILAPKRITCNLVIPGITETDAWQTASPPIDPVALATARCPMKEVISPADVGTAVAFLVSRKAGFITGAMLPVDGGLMLI